MLWQRTLLASLLAIGAEAAGIGALAVDGLSRDRPSAERRLPLVRGLSHTRQATGADTGTPLKADGSLDVAAWNDAANKACRDALRNLPQASNPSGACVCYNLPILNNNTGTFEADLRLFQASEPTGEFEGIPQAQIEVELNYRGASVTEVKSTGEAESVVAPPAADLSARQDDAADLKLLQSYLFIGEVDKDQMSDQINEAELQALVMPVVTLRATNGNGKPVSTNVSSNEAAFVAGEFSQRKLMSNFSMAELAVAKDMAAMKNGTVAFVLPGVQLLIFPVGLVITSIWLALFVVAYGAGTYARYSFKQAHMRRVAVAHKGAVSRF
ncbi:hypothetical protein BT67DRAFT_228129 [Trichocladium antarcticum]|uniref:Protein BIG1 n=1 Tax=Trichocladium antarcticum TaxID=1450529 RepID=A0AAN6UCP7_9PEZI|nr:hypothetical protein BT67DRAFT_228129 [Trichocladium antarcticum]